MSQTVVVHHAHHEDEGVYRLIYATVTEVVTDDDIVTVYSDPREVVWDASDPKWEELSAKEISKQQQKIVSDMLKQRDKEAKAQKPSKVKDLSGIGDTL
jgi:hypothetical protein